VRAGSAVLLTVLLVLTALVGGAGPVRADVLDDARVAIDAYVAEADHAELLGASTGSVRRVADGAAQNFRNGTVYYSADTGAHAVLGAIARRYRAVGGPAEAGFPTSDEQPAGEGKVSDFSRPGGAAIYWSPQTGARLLYGGVLRAWRASGGVDGPFGFPTSSTVNGGAADTSRFAGPDGTEISWSSTRGLQTVPAGLVETIPEMRVAADDITAVGVVADEQPEATAGGESSLTEELRDKYGWLAIGVVLLLIVLWAVIWLLRGRRRRSKESAAESKPAESTPAESRPAKIAAVVDAEPVSVEAGEPELEPELEPEPAPAEPEEILTPIPIDLPDEPEGMRLVFDGDEPVDSPTLVVNFESGDTALQVAYENNALGDDARSGDDVILGLLHDEPEEPAQAEAAEAQAVEPAAAAEPDASAAAVDETPPDPA